VCACVCVLVRVRWREYLCVCMSLFVCIIAYVSLCLQVLAPLPISFSPHPVPWDPAAGELTCCAATVSVGGSLRGCGMELEGC